MKNDARRKGCCHGAASTYGWGVLVMIKMLPPQVWGGGGATVYLRFLCGSMRGTHNPTTVGIT